MTSGQLFYTSNAVQTTLAASVTNSATGIELTSISGWPVQFPCTLLLEWGTANQEVVTLTQASTGAGPFTFANCLRGQDGTTGVSHSSGAQANHGVSARDFFQIAPVVNICAYGADPTGTNDCTTAINNAIAAIPSGGGSIYAPPGSYKHSGTLLFAQNQGMTGAGSTATTFNYTGNSAAVEAALSGSFTGSAYGGRFDGFYLNGYSAGGSAIGLQVSNLQGTSGNDIAIYGFSSIGLYHLNSSGDWSEQGNWSAIRLVQNGTAAVFDHSSFDYSNFDFTIVTGAGQGGVTLQNAAQLQGCKLRIRGDFYGHASSNTAAVIAIDPAGGPGTSYITNTECDVAVESAGSGVGPYTILMNSTNSASQFTGTGILSFSPVAIAFQGYTNPSFVPFSFAGIIEDPVIGSLTPGADALLAYGQIITNDITVHGNGNYASGNPAMFLAGASQTWQFFCDNGTGNWGVWDQTHSKLGLTLSASTELLTLYGGTSTAQSVPVITPSFANGTAAQLSDTTRDYQVYLQVGTAGTAFSLAIGPTSTPANTLFASATPAAGEFISVRLPAGWYLKWAGTATTIATQTAVGC